MLVLVRAGLARRVRPRAAMFLAPFPLIFSWLVSLASVAILVGGVYLIWAWYVGLLVGSVYLVAGLVLTAWSFLGRFVVLAFHPGGPDEPHSLEPDGRLRVPAPDGTTLYVETYGRPDAPRLVLTHGAGANRTSWYYVIGALRDRFNVVVWDMPGLGHSQKPRGADYSLDRHADNLRIILDATGDRPALLVGHSMGGMVVLTFCRLFGQHLGTMVAGLALVDTSHTNPTRWTTGRGWLVPIQGIVLEPLLHVTAWLAPLVWLMNWLAYLNGTSHLLASLCGFAGSQTRGQLDLAARYNPLAWPGVQAREVLATMHYDASDVLAETSLPVRVCTGHLDRLIVPETARFMAEHLPRSVLVTLRPAGHMAVFERHETLTSELSALAEEAFAESVGSSSDASFRWGGALRGKLLDL